MAQSLKERIERLAERHGGVTELARLAGLHRATLHNVMRGAPAGRKVLRGLAAAGLRVTARDVTEQAQ